MKIFQRIKPILYFCGQTENNFDIVYLISNNLFSIPANVADDIGLGDRAAI